MNRNDKFALIRSVAIDNASEHQTTQRTARRVLEILHAHTTGDSDTWTVDQSTLAAKCDCSKRTLQRALSALSHLGYVSNENAAKRGGNTQHRYRIHWDKIAPTQQVVQRDATATQRNATVTPRDASLTPRNATVSQRAAMMASPYRNVPKIIPISSEVKQQQPSGAVVAVSPGEDLDLAPFAATLDELGVCRVADALRGARQLQLTAADVTARIAAYRELPPDARDPAKLFNWLTKRNSFRPTQTAAIHVRPLPDIADVAARSDFIQRAKREGMPTAEIQRRVTAFADRRLGNERRNQAVG